MPIYKYRARNSSGRLLTGTIDAPTEAVALSTLDADGYLPISLRVSRGVKGGFPLRKRMARIKPSELVVFTRQLTTVVRSNIPILSGLAALSAQAESAAMRQVISRVISDVEAGLSLSASFARYPEAFPEIYTATVGAGETGGVLDMVLERLSDLLEHEAAVSQNLKAAIRYPLTVVTMLFSAFFFLTTFVIPKFAAIYSGAGVVLPLPTRIMILLSHILRNYWYLLIAGVFVLIGLFRRYIKTKNGRWQWDRIKLVTPVFGPLFTKMAISRFAQMFAVLDRSGLPIIRTLDVISRTLGNVVIAREMEVIKKSVEEGRGMSEPLLKSKVFPPLVTHMVAIGERSGTTDELLEGIQRHYDNEINTIIKNLTTLIEPILTVGLGIMVLFLALAIFLPMWKLIDVFKGGH